MIEPNVVYRSGIDYSQDIAEWLEEGQLPPCVDPFKIGRFICSCGQHEVMAEMSADPKDQGPRIARTVTKIS